MTPAQRSPYRGDCPSWCQTTGHGRFPAYIDDHHATVAAVRTRAVGLLYVNLAQFVLSTDGPDIAITGDDFGDPVGLTADDAERLGLALLETGRGRQITYHVLTREIGTLAVQIFRSGGATVSGDEFGEPVKLTTGEGQLLGHALVGAAADARRYAQAPRRPALVAA